MTTSARAALDAIVQRMLLGTQRTSTSAPTHAIADLQTLIARVDASDSERALLSTAALVSGYELAGRLPVATLATPTSVAVVEAQDQLVVPARVARFLTTMLGGVNDEILREWLSEVAARGWRVPTPMLPSLLDVGHGATYLRKLIVPVLGERGRWLAARNDDWHWAAAPATEDDSTIRKLWETGTPDERAAILATVRARDAAAGRALLESTWAEEPAAQRAAFLTIMGEVGLTTADEPFLETALDDRRQEVRRAAADLLQRIPASALVARMTARAAAALGWKPHKLRSAEITVEPPKNLDDASERDGVISKPPAGMGERSWWLAQTIAVVPPRVWSERWSAAPDAVVAAANNGDWTKPLTEGFAAAAVLHNDAAWAEALLDGGFPGDKPTPLAPKLDELLRVLDVARREAFVAKVLRDAPQSDEAVPLIAATDHQWSEKFAATALGWMRKRISSTPSNSPVEWHFREMIPRLALRVPPMLAGATEKWPTGDDAAGYARALDRFISILTFRRELAVELDR